MGVGAGGWDAGDGLYLLMGLFRVSMSPRIASHRSRQPREAKRHITNTGVTHISYLMPSMGPIVSVVTLHGWQNLL